MTEYMKYIGNVVKINDEPEKFLVLGVDENSIEMYSIDNNEFHNILIDDIDNIHKMYIDFVDRMEYYYEALSDKLLQEKNDDIVEKLNFISKVLDNMPKMMKK